MDRRRTIPVPLLAATVTVVLGVALWASWGRIREQWFLRKLRTGTDDEARSAALVLVKMGSARAAPVLIERVLDPRTDQEQGGWRWIGASLLVLDESGLTELLAALRGDHPVLSVFASRVLRGAPAGAYRRISQDLFRGDAVSRQRVLEVLGGTVGDLSSASDLLVRYFEGESNPRYRALAAGLLGRCQSQSSAAVGALVPALRDPDRAVRMFTVLALGELGGAAESGLDELREMSRTAEDHEFADLVRDSIEKITGDFD